MSNGEPLYVGLAITPTLRDYFAGQALAGMMAKASAQDLLIAGGRQELIQNVVTGAYALADAMLIARDAHK